MSRQEEERIVKFHFGTELRRLKVTSWEGVIDAVEKLFVSPQGPKNLFYYDEENEKIRLTSAAEWQEALSLSSPSKPLHLFVELATGAQSQPQQDEKEAEEKGRRGFGFETFAQPQQQFNLADLLQSPLVSTLLSSFSQHLNAQQQQQQQQPSQPQSRQPQPQPQPQQEATSLTTKCACCDNIMSTEIKYRCLVCPSYFLCGECGEAKEAIHDHPFVTEELSAQPPRPATSCPSSSNSSRATTAPCTSTSASIPAFGTSAGLEGLIGQVVAGLSQGDRSGCNLQPLLTQVAPLLRDPNVQQMALQFLPLLLNNNNNRNNSGSNNNSNSSASSTNFQTY